jgi:hypothetical protein
MKILPCLLGSSIAALLAVAAFPAAAQEATEDNAFFRIDFGSGIVAVTGPGGGVTDPGGGGDDDDDDDEGGGGGDTPGDLNVTYQSVSGPVGTPLVSSPVIPSAYQDHQLSFILWNRDEAWNPQIDEQTGAVTITPVHGGVHRVTVLVTATDGNGASTETMANVDFVGDAAFAIDVAAAGTSFRKGTHSGGLTFTAEMDGAVPANADSGWFVKTSGTTYDPFPEDLFLVQPSGDGAFLTLQLSHPDQNLQVGNHSFQVGWQGDGQTVLSAPVDLEVLMAPSMRYVLGEGTGYRTDSDWTQIAAGVNVNVPAEFDNGAERTASVSSLPAPVSADLDGLLPMLTMMFDVSTSLPAGLSIGENGNITGSTMDTGYYMVPVAVVAEDGPGPAYNYHLASFVVTGLPFVNNVPNPPPADADGDSDGDHIPNHLDPDPGQLTESWWWGYRERQHGPWVQMPDMPLGEAQTEAIAAREAAWAIGADQGHECKDYLVFHFYPFDGVLYEDSFAIC